MDVIRTAQHDPGPGIGIIASDSCGHDAGRPAGTKFYAMAKSNIQNAV